MNDKLTVVEFRQIKSLLNSIINKIKNSYQLSITIKEELANQYYNLQNKLLSCDLSDIPFDEWKDLRIIAYKGFIADLTKTKANIDFDIVSYSPYINYKGCNIRNFDKLNRIVNPNHFDDEIVKSNPNNFLSDLFSEQFKQTIYECKLTLKEVFSLDFEQIEELSSKYIFYNLESKSRKMVEELGLPKVIEMYYEFSQQKDNRIFRKMIFNRNFGPIDISKLPETFVEENKEILLIGADIPEDLRKRYYNRKLTIDDIINNISLFKKIEWSNFISSSVPYKESVRFLSNFFGDFPLLNYIKNFPKHFNYIIKTDQGTKFCKIITAYNDANSEKNSNNIDEEYEMLCYLAVFFSVCNKLKSKEQLMLYDPSLFPLEKGQKIFVEALGLENIKKLENEMGFFSHLCAYKDDLTTLTKFADFYNSHYFLLTKNNIDFKKGTLDYEEFLNQFANLLDFMRSKEFFGNFPSYDWIQGEFREKHPEIFIDSNAPESLKEAFYKNYVSASLLFDHKDYIPYLVNKNLLNIINGIMKLRIPSLKDEQGYVVFDEIDFKKEYIFRYGNKKFLKLLAKYGRILTSLTSSITIESMHGEIEDETLIEKQIRKAIYAKILGGFKDYRYLENVPDFLSAYPDIFTDLSNLENISEEDKKVITDKFYRHNLSFDDIREYPQLEEILKDKNIELVFDFKTYSVNKYHAVELLKLIGNEKFLQLCSRYGKYLGKVVNSLEKYLDKDLSFEDLIKTIDEIIIDKIRHGELEYFEEDAPLFLKENHPEFFLDESTPAHIKRYFYNYKNFYPMSFTLLKQDKTILPYLEGKDLLVALARNKELKKDVFKYFEMFGSENAVKLGLNKPETVDEMLKSHKVDLMKKWFDKTGGKFIPDYVVMQNFDLEEADKFLTSASNWSSLMKIENFSKKVEARDAMLKLAYSFGAFDNDQKGFKKLIDLLTGIPRTLALEQGKTIEKLFDDIKDNALMELVILPLSITPISDAIDEEKFDIDKSQNMFTQLYRKNDDGSYILNFNPQRYPKVAKALRDIFEEHNEIPIINPDKAHKLFGGFQLIYDPDFREFLLANMPEILTNPEYIKYIAGIQKQFNEIKVLNSNRHLTLSLAVSYIQSNKFLGIELGNDKVAEISAIAGYSQSDFDTLQKIYDYGKRRTFSSIPRIEATKGKYSYEMLRLDDPLAMAIGTLTDCCQELNDTAEACMEHSMVDKNGRVFVIRDELGNIVSQSWVWRNKDVLCFDNIEIPDKAFAREKSTKSREKFTDEIYAIYKEAANELIKKDEKVYKELLESGKITEEEYEGLRLGKITVGLGYNDIAESIKKNAYLDKDRLARPLHFEAPVALKRHLYTSDSSTQYVLEKREDRKSFDGKTLPVHNDTYILYDDTNFNLILLNSLERLETITKGTKYNLNTSIEDEEHIVTEIAYNCELNPKTTRIILSPNFAIIFDINDSKLTIGDLYFNTLIDENIVAMQIRLALEQISDGKEVDISKLNNIQQEMYNKAVSLSDEIDKERGVGSGR